MTEYTRIPIRDAEHKRLVQLQNELAGKIDSYLSRPSLSDVIEYLLDQHGDITMSNQEYNVWASNDQGATTTVANGLPSVSACERAARAELGKGWTVHIDKVLTAEDGEVVGTEEIKRFRISR